MAWTFEATAAGYANMWRTAMLKGGADASQADSFADKIIAAEQRYKAVQAATGVPWYFIGALHMRESSCNFAGVLHNGEKIIGTGRLTTLEPPGRGPFPDWPSSAIDALKLKDMHRVQAWSPARMLFQAEVFNGLGYVGKGINSPYVWAGTNYEQSGKYVADHVFDANADDTQLGVAAVLIRLAQKRPDIHADLYPAKPTEKPPVETEDQLIKEIKGLRAELAQLPAALASALKGAAPAPIPAPIVEPQPIAEPRPSPIAEPAPLPAPMPAPVIVPVVAPSTTPILEKPGVGIGVLGGIATLVLQALGVVGPTTGETATTAGQLLPAMAAGVAALGATGMLGSWGVALSSVFSLLTKGLQQPGQGNRQK